MDVKEARRIWGSNVPQDVLEEWVAAYNKRVSVTDPNDVPKGATIEIDPKTGKGVASDKY